MGREIYKKVITITILPPQLHRSPTLVGLLLFYLCHLDEVR